MTADAETLQAQVKEQVKVAVNREMAILHEIERVVRLHCTPAVNIGAHKLACELRDIIDKGRATSETHHAAK